MRHTTSKLSGLVMGLVLAGLGSTAHADEPDTAGGLVGASYMLFGADIGTHSGKAALGNDLPPTEISGAFGMVRINAGVLLRVTRFKAEAGLEGSLGLGWISGGAYGGKEEGGLSADISGGILVVPYRSKLVTGAAFKLNAGVGSDHDVDYLYAGARFGFGENDGDIGVEPAYLYRVGDAPTGSTLTEHRLGLNLRFYGFAVSLNYVFGESTKYTRTVPAEGAPRGQRFQVGTMRKGEYSEWLFTLGYAWR